MPDSAPRARVLSALFGTKVVPPPVVCPGGMMTMATLSAMARCGHGWPGAHSDARGMAEIVLATREETGLDGLSVPFCMTVEAEALGCDVDMGDARVLPHVSRERIADVTGIDSLPKFLPGASPRVSAVLEAIALLRRAAPDQPVTSAVVGPVTLAATVMVPDLFFRLARRDPAAVDRLISKMERVTLDFALAQRAAGADVVMVAEPSATGEILGARHFARFAGPALARILRRLRAENLPHILHICGDLRTILPELRGLNEAIGGSLALSVDAMVAGRQIRESLPGAIRIGNLDALLLLRGPVDLIERAARRAAREFDIVSPACGLVPATPPENLRAMTQAVRGYRGPDAD